jgi:ubiquinone/menaquinone biosynthesis C-methylase UbiE
MSDELAVAAHYSGAGMVQRVREALHSAGLDGEGIEWSKLAPLDQFHVRGLAATKELAAGLGVEAGTGLLDIGCGLGGPARFLAATHGCRVIGIDLSAPFVEVATLLGERAGLAGQLTFVQGDALELPFPDASFDHAWTLHVAMNIADRARLYANARRVLKPQGRFGIYDVVAGNGEELIYPVPWARGAQTSFLLTADEMRVALEVAGFAVVSWADKTEAALSWFAEQSASGAPPPPFGLHLVMGPDFPAMAANLRRNLEAGKVGLVQAVVRRA